MFQIKKKTNTFHKTHMKFLTKKKFSVLFVFSHGTYYALMC